LSSPEIHHITVTSEQANQRLDKWLSQLDIMPSRSRAAELIEKGLVTRDGKALKASAKLSAGQTIRIEIPAPQPKTLQPMKGELDIMFEDDDLLVINKPAGLVVHPAAGHAQDTLVNIILHHVGKFSSRLSMGFGEQRPGIVHRLDRDTSGILVVAKNDLAHHGLAEQFRKKSAHRVYWALVQGLPPRSEATLNSYLARHPQDRKRFASNEKKQGKLAITHYKQVQVLPSKISWLKCVLETGRTHQIRVHLSEAGLPILGDPLYGPRKNSMHITRMALHAVELGFVHPRTGERMFYHAGWPEQLATMARALGFKDV
jgi:23S rRNA pseudouridine1911/1915/1917 synthase